VSYIDWERDWFA